VQRLAAQYAEDFIDRLHLIWGPGFLSPGGPAEVAEIVCGLDLKDKLVLDIGCGTGGPAIVLARDMGARLVCIDVEPQLIERARRLASEAGVTGRIEFRMVDPGPLPFEAKTFDAVFSKDALIHIPDKKALYIEILRVLRPGGAFAASDWLSGENARDDPALHRFIELAHLRFAMATARETARIMRDVGFGGVETKDRNAWYAALSAQEAAAIDGPLREQVIEVSDLETYESWLVVRRQLAEATRSGGLRPTHLRGIRPS
jgi:phosphoethanolamine N-methyltransferase